jgi:hypothetical protein
METLEPRTPGGCEADESCVVGCEACEESGSVLLVTVFFVGA